LFLFLSIVHELWNQTQQKLAVASVALHIITVTYIMAKQTAPYALFGLLQNETPVYNMAAGTCLTAQRPVSGEYAVMELCSISANNKWDFVVT
jgi:hypothetical protein